MAELTLQIARNPTLVVLEVARHSSTKSAERRDRGRSTRVARPRILMAYFIISTPPVTSAKIVAPFLLVTLWVHPFGR